MDFALQNRKRKTAGETASGHARAKNNTSTVSSIKSSDDCAVGTFYSTGPVFNLSPVQAKYTVGAVNDPLEQEADTVADHVITGKPLPSISRLSPSLTGNVSRTELEPDEPEADTLQAKFIQRRNNEEQDEAKTEPQPLFIQRHAGNDEEREAQQFQENNGSGTGSGQTKNHLAKHLNQMRGRGSRLPGHVRDTLGRKLGANLGGVNIHSDETAAKLNRRINARAFTVGNDIFFGQGEYAPHSQPGQRLLAHELTHVVQQSASPVSQQIQRNPPDDSDGNDDANVINTETEYDGPEGSASTAGDGTMTINEITFPDVAEKARVTGSENVEIRKGNVVRDTHQVREWSSFTRDGPGLTASLGSKLDNAWQSGSRDSAVYFLRVRLRGENFLVGTRTQIRNRVIRPYWKPDGRTNLYDVDHKKEYQLGGDDDRENLWLLDSRTNRSSGSRINSKINQAIEGLLGKWTSSSKPDTEMARNNYTITLRHINWNGPVEGNSLHYSIDDIANRAIQMGPVIPMNRADVQAAHLDPGEGKFVVFNNATGGRAREIDLPSTTGSAIPFTDESFIAGFRPTGATFVGDNDNYIEVSGNLFADNSAIPGDGYPVDFTISRMTNLPQAGYLNVTRAEEKIRQVFAGEIEVSALSPLRLTNVGFDALGTPVIEGIVDTNISFLEGANIGFFIRGNDLGIEKSFPAPELNTPSPFEIEEASLTISLSTQRGLAVEGSVDFKIEGVGDGTITANVGTSQEFRLAGDFNFDERIFGEGTTAQARMAYESGEWSVGGTISIPEGKVPGVSSATINVDYSEAEGFSASGEAELDVPGVESGTLSITHNEEEGFIIGGSFTLSGDTPGIRGGTISAELREKEDASGFAISARGEAQPDIPGINSNLIVSYNDGAFTAEIEADYSRGMLSGQINVGVTNRTVGEDGELSETAAPDNPLIVYGGGELTIRIAPWLQGTAGVQFAPNGEITVVGRIGIPDELEIFARREVNKSIFNIAVQAPIFPGIVAEIGGGLGATAGFGPGVINRLELGITYNPEHEEDTTITGDANFRVPADAGLRLSLRAGVGLGITGASATGGLEIGGALGIEGAAEADAHIEWSPSRGLDLTANVRVSAQPVFIFSIDGYVSVRLAGFSVYDETYRFREFRFGSDYTFGIRLPIHYQQGQPFNISLDDVVFEVPDIDTDELLEGLIARIA